MNMLILSVTVILQVASDGSLYFVLQTKDGQYSGAGQHFEDASAALLNALPADLRSSTLVIG
jgi:hypothetical protein